MKGYIIAIGIVVLLLAGIYIFVPGKLTVSSAISLGANREGIYRSLVNNKDWRKWWPGKTDTTDGGANQWTFGDIRFKIDSILYDAIRLQTTTHGRSFN